MDVCVGKVACTWVSQSGVRGSVGVCAVWVRGRSGGDEHTGGAEKKKRRARTCTRR